MCISLLGRALFGLVFLALAVGLAGIAMISVPNAVSSRQVIPGQPGRFQAPFQISLVGQRLLPSQGVLQATVVVHLESRGLADYIDVATRQSIASCDAKTFQCALRREFLDRTLTVAVQSDYGITPLSTFATSISIQSMLTPGLRGIPEDVSRALDISIAGGPSSFPSDRYAFDLTMYADIRDAVDRTGYFAPAKPVVDMSGLDPGLGAVVTGPNGKGNVHFQLEIARVPLITMYTYVVALVPICFALLFLHLLFINPASRMIPLADFLVALAATALAVLPLRTVLVPPDIQGLTRVDTLLGVGLLTLSALGLARYSRDVLFLKTRPVAKTT